MSQHLHQYPSDRNIVAMVKKHGSYGGAARALGLPESTFKDHVYGRPALHAACREALKQKVNIVRVDESPLTDLAARVHAFLGKRKRTERPTVHELADDLDLAPKRVREALSDLREAGYRIPEENEDGGSVHLQRIAPSKQNLHKSLLSGDVARVGVVSDTHLSSNEEALPELELAYDVFEEEGITEVWHAGDFTCGRGIFRTQDSEIQNHTFESQVDYLVENYPRRNGITTRGISGNHDIEGDFGRIGANPVAALANQRDDVEFLGDYSAWVELPNGGWVHLLHGKGGGSYAFSYQAQKLADGYAPGRKPSVLIVGHFHRKGNIEARGIEVVWPGCFEWRSPFMERLGLTPTVGFHILNLTLGEDGSLVKFVPEWRRIWEGRKVGN